MSIGLGEWLPYTLSWIVSSFKFSEYEVCELEGSMLPREKKKIVLSLEKWW